MAIEKTLLDSEMERMNKVLRNSSDPLFVILRGHLYSETLLERLIEWTLPGGRKLIEKGGPSYRQKLAIVESLNKVPANIMMFLRNLNRLRNSCTHDPERDIGEEDVDELCRPLGDEYVKIRNDAVAGTASLSDIAERSRFTRLWIMRTAIIHGCGFLWGLWLGLTGAAGDERA